MDIRRVVTGRDAAGTSRIVEDRPAELVAPAALAGIGFHLLWATEAGASLVAPAGAANPYWPGDDGTRFLVVHWEPVGVAVDDGADVEALLPGMAGAFETEDPAMHTSSTIDYGVCLAGEMWLELDDGEQTRITPGTCVVQRGTRHKWENRSDQRATMLFVLVGTADTAAL